VVAFLGAATACGGGDDSEDASSDSAAVAVSTTPVAPAARDAAGRVAETYATDLAALQAAGAKALQPGGDVVGFYRSFDDRTRSALTAYGALQVPPEVTAVRDRAVALLQQQADLLSEIADHAIEDAGESVGPQLEQLAAVMNDFETTNAELMRRMGVQQAGA
jgi:hypothetical protein